MRVNILESPLPDWKCRINGCILHRRADKKSGSAKQRRKYLFCSIHCDMRNHVNKIKYREMQGNAKMELVL